MQAIIEKIVADAAALGVRHGGVLLVHSSLRSLGKPEGGAEAVVQGLLAALGPDGTLLMPALSYETVTAISPEFDVRHTPSCVGALTEYFRCRPGTIRSVHPTHSVCGTGPRASLLLGSHAQDTTPCGPHSPFRLLPAYDGQILLLGCGLLPNTSMHAVEELIVPPYLFTPELEYIVTLADGRRLHTRHRRHDFAGWRQRYDRVAQLLKPPQLMAGKILQADCHLIEARALWTEALAALQRDLFFFVEKCA
jgi:aminoglycoside 3-N-acetyltransferase